MTYEETAYYTELLPSGKAYQFNFVMQAKSVITHPSAGQVLDGQGFQEISGLAWSGNGRIKAVDVSVDGGNTWQPAVLQGPVEPICLTRFRLPWRWTGGSAVLQSRATDETGAVQPTRTAVLAERGTNFYYHYDAITSWRLVADGSFALAV